MRAAAVSGMYVAFFALRAKNTGAIAQLGERVLCKHEVVGSIPSGSTIILALSRFALFERVCCSPSGLSGEELVFEEETVLR